MATTVDEGVMELKEAGSSNESNKVPKNNNFVSKLQEYEKLFSDRYTPTDPGYMTRVEEKLQPPVVHPWPREQGGWNRQSNDRNWRGNQRGNQRGRWNNQQRPQYGGNRRQFDDRQNQRNRDDRSEWSEAGEQHRRNR